MTATAEQLAAKGITPDDLRESVRDFRDPRSDEQTRQAVRDWWAEHGIPNQFAARLLAAELDRQAQYRPPVDHEEQQ